MKTKPKRTRKPFDHFGTILDAAMIGDNERCAAELVKALRHLVRDVVKEVWLGTDPDFMRATADKVAERLVPE
jgi:hypothetical protein